MTGPWNPTTYDEAWTRMQAAGKDPHGEVAFFERLRTRHPGITGPILDAGCGTGRVAIELARRGYDVQGTDVDSDMLGHAQAKSPLIRWHLGDLATIDLATHFGLVIMAGNVILFVDKTHRASVVENIARLLAPGGWLVAGVQLARADGRHAPVGDWDVWTSVAGLDLVERWSSWDDDPWVTTSDYVVSVHRRSQ